MGTQGTVGRFTNINMKQRTQKVFYKMIKNEWMKKIGIFA